MGQISHSVVLGTFNVGEQGDGVVPDLGRVSLLVFNKFHIETVILLGQVVHFYVEFSYSFLLLFIGCLGYWCSFELYWDSESEWSTAWSTGILTL